MSWGEDEREEQYYRYCYSCGGRWKTSYIYDTNHRVIKVPEGCNKRNEGKGGDFIICDWCDILFKKSELLKLIKTKSKEEILEIRIEKQREYWKKKKRRKWKFC